MAKALDALFVQECDILAAVPVREQWQTNWLNTPKRTSPIDPLDSCERLFALPS